MSRRPIALLALLLLAVLSGAPAVAQDAADEPSYPSPEWTQREAENFATVGEAPARQRQDPAFQQRFAEQSAANFLEFTQRQIEDPDWRSEGNVCATWGNECQGDPFRYPGVDDFYDSADVEPVAFLDTGLELDAGGARLSGRVWAPAGTEGAGNLPAVVIINGSVQAPETLYWWAAQALVRSGYVVMTFDPRGQGRSDSATPDGTQGSNANPTVFVTNLVDAIDFLRSTPDAPYAGNGDDPRAVTAFNPFWDRIDPARLGVAGHSLGAAGTSVTQGIQPWPGSSATDNPIDVIVAWDNLGLSTGGDDDGLAGYPLVPRVPAMGQSADYYLTPMPYTEPPDADDKRLGYLAWEQAGIDSYQLVIAGGSHYEWSLLPTFPTSDWEPGGNGGWGRPLAEHFTLAWFDRWLKAEGEIGFATADTRLAEVTAPGPPSSGGTRERDGALTGDGPTWCDRLSFYFTSTARYTSRSNLVREVPDIRAACLAQAPPTTSDGGGADANTGDGTAGTSGSGGGTGGAGSSGSSSTSQPGGSAMPATGGGALLVGVLLMAGAVAVRAARTR